jgi:hypothetical protein
VGAGRGVLTALEQHSTLGFLPFCSLHPHHSCTAGTCLEGESERALRARQHELRHRLFVGYQFSSHPGVEWGFEGFATHRFRGTGCSSEERTGIGPLFQVAFMGLKASRFTLAGEGGGELLRMGYAVTGELGLSYHLGPGL